MWWMKMSMFTCPYCGQYMYPQKHIINEPDKVIVIYTCQFCHAEIKTEKFKNRICPKCRNKTLRYINKIEIIGFDENDCLWKCSNCGYTLIAKPKGRLPKIPEVKLSFE